MRMHEPALRDSRTAKRSFSASGRTAERSDSVSGLTVKFAPIGAARPLSNFASSYSG